MNNELESMILGAGFLSRNEFLNLTGELMATHEGCISFEEWKQNDGTKSGLLGLLGRNPEVVEALIAKPVTRNPFKIDDDDRTAIGVSGGRTSAYMLWLVMQANGGKLPENTLALFENTGKEREETLQFVRDIEQHWGVPIKWLEYRDDEQGYAEVTFETASRNGEPFEAIIRKRNYLPNPVTRFCTVELKIRTGHKYLKSLGWQEDGWDQMVGIRADEPRRIAKIRARPSPEIKAETMIIPLAEAGITKQDVAAFWRAQPFDLGLPNRNGTTPWGNCDLCFLKGPHQVFSMIQEEPQRAVWWASMEAMGLSSKPDGARFRNDRPGYARMLEYATQQGSLFAGIDGDDDAIACFCGD
jgi:3'-phosphoadenosine 5'-phosphosulfate sulfotransferase (PAPS reductase)/FAD synthetase